MNQENQGYVYSKRTVKLEELQKLLKELAGEETYYFLRSPHAVSGICMKLPEEFPTAEGQIFNTNYELRWKKRKSDYDVLILSKSNLERESFKLEGFEQVSGNWETSDFDAYFYNNKPESRTKFPTKFPKGFTFKGLENEEIEPKAISIGQRYFKDKDTAIVHFIALTILGEISQKNA